MPAGRSASRPAGGLRAGVRPGPERLLMVHPRRRDGSGLRRTPALVALHHPPARRCRPLPSPNTASTLLSRPCRRPGDGYRVYPRLETSESVKLSELLELGFPPKKTSDVASADKTSKLRTLPSAASHSPRFRRFRTPPSPPLGPQLCPLDTLPRAIATQPPPWRPKTAAAAPPRAERSCADPGATLWRPEAAAPIQFN